MGTKTKIDWCDSSWNPVTGCRHGCGYCYADRIAHRFAGNVDTGIESIHELNGPIYRDDGTINPYPFGFEPTFHKYRLKIPQEWKKPRNIFVCSMADLMGQWVPDAWKQDVIAACKAAPQHRYLFLTKNPYGYNIWPTEDRPVEYDFDQDNFWIGCSMTGAENLTGYHWHYGRYLYAMGGNMLRGNPHRFISIEPILNDVMKYPGYHGSALREGILSKYAGCIEWVIIGAETGNRKGKKEPKREWVEKIVEACREAGKPVFMKESLRDMMGAEFVQEFPWN